MRHISIKVRMTIWFTVVMVVISSLMLVFVMLMNRNQVTKPPAAQVVSVVTRNADRLEVEHGVLDLSDVDLFRHGVYTQVFDEEGQLLAGSAPTELTEQLPLAEGDVRQAQGSDGLYDVYDVSIPAAGVWVRGTISHNARGGVMEVIVPLAWSLLPAPSADLPSCRSWAWRSPPATRVPTSWAGWYIPTTPWSTPPISTRVTT